MKNEKVKMKMMKMKTFHFKGSQHLLKLTSQIDRLLLTNLFIH